MVQTAVIVCFGFFTGCLLSTVLFDLDEERSMINAALLIVGTVTFCVLWYPRHKEMEKVVAEVKALKEKQEGSAR